MAINSQAKSLRDLERNLKKWSSRVSKKVIGQALNKSANPMVKEARSLAPQGQTGAFKKSLAVGKGKKLIRYKKTNTAVVVVGPNRDVIEGNSPYSKKYKHRPSTIAHLIENGHKNKDGSFAPPRPFMRPAFDRTKKKVLSEFERLCKVGMEREVAKI